MTRKSLVTVAGAFALLIAFAAAPALASNFDATQPMTDEWNMPVMVQGAKGGEVQAECPAWRLGEKSVTGKTVERTFFSPGIKWIPQPDRRLDPPENGDDYMDRM